MIDKEQLYKDTVNIVTSAVNGLYASSNANIDISTMINEIYNALNGLAQQIEDEK